MIDLIIAAVIGFVIGGFFGVMLMALVAGCRREDDK